MDLPSIPMSSEEDDEELSDSDQSEEQLDPRIRDKLEELNECTDNINKLEKHFEVLFDIIYDFHRFYTIFVFFTGNEYLIPEHNE